MVILSGSFVSSVPLGDDDLAHANGDDDSGLDTLNARQPANPDATEAVLSKVELCLRAKTDFAFVGKTLMELAANLSGSSRYNDLRSEADKEVRSLLAAGRKHLGRYKLVDAVRCFDLALDLAPGDSSVALSAALAFLRGHSQTQSDQRISQPILYDAKSVDSLRVKDDDEASAVTERYLAQAIARSSADGPVFREAIQRLVKCQVEAGKIDEMLRTLDRLPNLEATSPNLATFVAEHLITYSLNITAMLLRNERFDMALSIVHEFNHLFPKLPAVHLLSAEYALQKSNVSAAVMEFRQITETSADTFDAISFSAARQVWTLVSNNYLTCDVCGKTLPSLTPSCPYCDTPFVKRELLLDRYTQGIVHERTIAHIALAEILLMKNRPDSALEHVMTAISLIQKSDIPEPFDALRHQCQAKMEVNGLSAVYKLRVLLKKSRITPETLAEVEQIIHTEPEVFTHLPYQTRLRLLRHVIRAGHLEIALQMHSLAQKSMPHSDVLAGLGHELERNSDSQFRQSMSRANDAFTKGQFARALSAVDLAICISPDSSSARFLRAQIRVHLGQPLGALSDFRHVIETTVDTSQNESARWQATEILEAHGDLTQAIELLSPLTSDDAQRWRARLLRRLGGQPVIYTQLVDEVTMLDSLKHTPNVKGWQGFFAVALRAVGSSVVSAAGRDEIVAAQYEFLQALNGLGNSEGDPAFALRYIALPEAETPERGHLIIVLLARVFADNQTDCAARALELWQTIKGILPLAHRHVYAFEAITDENELTYLLHPFEPTSVAQIVRREELPRAEGNRYAIFPFATGTIDLHNFCWALLRESSPSMVSIHLVPTTLMSWERETLERIMLNAGPNEAEGSPELGPLALSDPISRWWQGTPRWGQAQANRYLVDNLSDRAYVLTINVVGSEASSSLLPEVVASTLLGPVHTINGMLFGGYEIVRATSEEELSAAHRNVETLDVENWVFTSLPTPGTRLRHLVTEVEAALAFRLPIPTTEGVPGLESLDVRPVAPPTNLPSNGTILGTSVTQAGSTYQPIRQSADDRRRHLYVVGKTGSGKSTLLRNLALQDMAAGHGVCVIDPHGDLVEDILQRIPKYRADDVIVFDPADEERPIGLNLLEARTDTEKHQIVTEFIGLLMRMYDPHQQGIVGPRFQHNVRNAMLTVMSAEGNTLIEVVRALTDMRYVQELLTCVTDPLVRNYWTNQIANTTDFHKSEILDYIVSKFNRFVGDERVRNIVGQRHTTVDFRQTMDNRQILLVNLSKGKIGPENAQFLGLLVTQRLLLSALSRADMSLEKRPDFFLYVDEFQNFATDLFCTVLSEGRKYGIAATVANQYLTQLDHSVLEAVMGNVGSFICFRLGMQDANALAQEFYPVLSSDDLLNLPKYTASVKLLVDGIAAQPFVMRTVPDLSPIDSALAETVRRASRQKYGRDGAKIKEEIIARFQE